MKNKTAEEVLMDLIGNPEYTSEFKLFEKDTVLQAMKEYAQQESIGFAEWLLERYEPSIFGNWKRLNSVSSNTYSSKELYTQYLTDKNKAV